MARPGCEVGLEDLRGFSGTERQVAESGQVREDGANVLADREAGAERSDRVWENSRLVRRPAHPE